MNILYNSNSTAFIYLSSSYCISYLYCVRDLRKSSNLGTCWKQDKLSCLGKSFSSKFCFKVREGGFPTKGQIRVPRVIVLLEVASELISLYLAVGTSEYLQKQPRLNVLPC